VAVKRLERAAGGTFTASGCIGWAAGIRAMSWQDCQSDGLSIRLSDGAMFQTPASVAAGFERIYVHESCLTPFAKGCGDLLNGYKLAIRWSERHWACGMCGSARRRARGRQQKRLQTGPRRILIAPHFTSDGGDVSLMPQIHDHGPQHRVMRGRELLAPLGHHVVQADDAEAIAF